MSAADRKTAKRRSHEDIRERVVAFIPRLRRFAFSLTGDWDHMEELVQNTCERALTRQEQWKHGTSLESWMCRIAQNLWKDGLKSKKRRAQASDDSLHFLTDVDGRLEVERRSTLKAIIATISRLPADQRIVIALVCFDGHSYVKTAEILDIPIGTVMSRLARARQALYAGLYESDRGTKTTTLSRMSSVTRVPVIFQDNDWGAILYSSQDSIDPQISK